MRFHHAHIVTGKRRRITIDGMEITVLDDAEIDMNTIGPAYTLIRCAIICDEITVLGDAHDLDMPTPIYDQLRKEMNNAV